MLIVIQQPLQSLYSTLYSNAYSDKRKIDGTSLHCKTVPECFGGTEDITELVIGLVLGNLFGTFRLNLCIVPFLIRPPIWLKF